MRRAHQPQRGSRSRVPIRVIVHESPDASEARAAGEPAGSPGRCPALRASLGYTNADPRTAHVQTIATSRIMPRHPGLARRLAAPWATCRFDPKRATRMWAVPDRDANRPQPAARTNSAGACPQRRAARPGSTTGRPKRAYRARISAAILPKPAAGEPAGSPGRCPALRASPGYTNADPRAAHVQTIATSRIMPRHPELARRLAAPWATCRFAPKRATRMWAVPDRDANRPQPAARISSAGGLPAKPGCAPRLNQGTPEAGLPCVNQHRDPSEARRGRTGR
jgi:hypothetical protein